MKANHLTPRSAPVENRSELLILPDGTILAHNLTPALAELLQTLAPQDDTLKQRAASAPAPERGHSCPQQPRKLSGQGPTVSPPPSQCSQSPSPAFSAAAPISPIAYELPD